MIFKHGKKLLLSGCILLVLMGTSTLYALETSTSPLPIQIDINKNSLINSDWITLGQISRISAKGFLKEALKKTELGRSPKPGDIKAVAKQRIVSVVRSQQYLPENVNIECPDLIYVKRASQTVSEKAVRQFVVQSLALQYKKKDSELTAFNVRGLSVYPRGKLTFKTDPELMVDTKGRLSFFLDILVDGDKKDRVRVKGAVAMYARVLCAAETIKRGRPVLPESVVFEKKNLFDLENNYLTDFQSIQKMIAKTGISKGEPLTQALFCKPHLVKKGDIVTLVAKNNNLLIVTSGICMEDGFENRPVKVENLSSGKTVRGIVKSRSKVEVIY